MNTIVVESRNDTTAAYLRKMADLMFTERERRLLEAEIGVQYPKINFSLREYAALLQAIPLPDNDTSRVHMSFYRFAITIDMVFARLRTIDNLVAKMDEIGIESVLDDLKQNLPHPLFIPWFVMEHPAFSELTQEEKQTLTFRGLGPDVSAWYLCHFRIVSDLMAITQGLFLKNPESNMALWDNAGRAGIGIMANSATDLQMTTRQLEELDGARTNQEAAKIAIGAVCSAEVRTAEGGAVADPSKLHEINHRLSSVVKQSGLLLEIYKAFSEMLHRFHARLARTPLVLGLGTRDFMPNTRKGPLIDDIFKCEPGLQPKLVGYDGRVLNGDDAVIVINGHTYVSSMVDIQKSGCTEKIEL